MTKQTLLAAVVTAGIAAFAWSSAPPANAQGPGMMGSPGYGPGMMYGDRDGPGRRGYGYGPGMTGFGPGMMGGCFGWGFGSGGQTSAFAEGRIAFLKAELAVTDAQKPVWDAYAEALKGNLQSMQSMRQIMQTAFEANTPVERLDAHIAGMETRLGALKAVKPALANLYAALSSEQKKKADDVLTGVGCMM
jgi:hypothetical protein